MGGSSLYKMRENFVGIMEWNAWNELDNYGLPIGLRLIPVET